MRTHLAADGDLVDVLVAHGGGLLVLVVEGDGHRRLGHAGLPLLVHQLLQAPRAHLH